MTLQEFTQVFAPLAVQLRATDADEATIRVYYDALKDLDLELVQMAATALSSSAEWFPKTSEWRAATVRIEGERQEAMRSRLRDRRRLGLPALCTDCDDTGWQTTHSGGRYQRCACQKLRRLEVLGRRPLPELPETASR